MKLYELMQKLDIMQQIIIKDRNEPNNIYSGALIDASGSWIFQDIEVTNIWTKGPYLVIEVERC
jgi:hypothetical protein